MPFWMLLLSYDEAGHCRCSASYHLPADTGKVSFTLHARVNCSRKFNWLELMSPKSDMKAQGNNKLPTIPLRTQRTQNTTTLCQSDWATTASKASNIQGCSLNKQCALHLSHQHTTTPTVVVVVTLCGYFFHSEKHTTSHTSDVSQFILFAKERKAEEKGSVSSVNSVRKHLESNIRKRVQHSTE